MERYILQNFIDLNLSQREIAEKLNKSQSSIRHWLKKYNLKTNYNNLDYIKTGLKKCIKCKLDKELKYFYKKDKISNNLQNKCKQCSNEDSVNKMVATKIKMINYKGGKCFNCHIKLEDSHYCIFDFHHRDRKEKDRNINTMRSLSWDKLVTELDKCDLLCSNCHRLEHAKTYKNDYPVR